MERNDYTSLLWPGYEMGTVRLDGGGMEQESEPRGATLSCFGTFEHFPNSFLLLSLCIIE